MRIKYFPLWLLVLYVSHVVGKENNVNTGNVENLKLLRKSVNFAYRVSNNFLDFIRGSTPPHLPAQYAVKTFSKRDGFTLSELVPIFLSFVGYVSLMLVGLLFVIFVPIVGFCFCCCRCAGKCGGKIRGMDPKHAACKRYTYALLLGIISIIQLAGIVLAFINNQLIHDSLSNPSVEISAVQQFSVGTKILQSSLKNISEAIDAAENSTRTNIDNEIRNADVSKYTCSGYFSVLTNESNFVNIKNDLWTISRKLNETVSYLQMVKRSNENLQNYSSELKKAISQLEISNIRLDVCKMLDRVIGTDFDNLKELMRKQISIEPSAGKKLRDIVKFFQSTILENWDWFRTNYNEYFKVEYLEYRMYVCIGVCCLLLLIVLFYFLGLCFGQCGERPFEDARICNRGVGANLMMAGVAFAFLFTPMIMFLEMPLFLHGGLTQTETCRYLTSTDPKAVRTLDSSLKIYQDLSNTSITKTIFDSVFNGCPIVSMAVAFKIDDNMMTSDITQKIDEINAKVNQVPNGMKSAIVDSYFKAVEGLLSNINSEIRSIRGQYDGFDEGTKKNILEKLMSILTEISSFSIATVKERVKNSFSKAAVVGFDPALKSKSREILSNIYLSPYKNVSCDGINKSARTIVHATCVTFLWPFNGFWSGVGICLIFTIPAMIFAVKLAGLYRRTETYSADYEEPDYHSYMGFYTNNADNIPMTRPKSAKSNQKNRNSNSNNKESLKQNNPQYLPVYPYDAYE